MKGFFVFLGVVFLLLGALGYYMITHQDPDSTVVRMNGKWVVIKKEKEAAPAEAPRAP